MKINTRKSVILTALAVVVLTTALVIGCTSPVGELLEKGEKPTPPGTGRVRLSINSRNTSRTILPTVLPNDLKYWVTFNHGSAPYSVSIDSTGANTADTITGIPVASYTGISVVVYTSASELDNDTDVAAAAIGNGSYSGTVAVTNGGTAEASSGVPFSITTTLYTPGSPTSGTGAFSYDITNAATLITGATFKIVNRDGTSGIFGGTGGANRPVVYGGAAGSTITGIPTGYYNVIFTLKDNKVPANTVNFYQILHVYKNMTSTFEFTFNNNLFPSPPPTGGASITVAAPSLPGNASVSIGSSGTAGVIGVTSGVASGTQAIIVTLLTDGTATLTLTITSSSAITAFSFKNGEAELLTLNSTSTPGLIPNSNVSTKTVSFTIDTTDTPFDAYSDYWLIVEADGHSLPPIIFKKNN